MKIENFQKIEGLTDQEYRIVPEAVLADLLSNRGFVHIEIDDTKDFKDQLAELIKERGISGRELSRRSGVTQGHVSSILTGKFKPGKSTRNLLVMTLGFIEKKC